MRTKCCAGFILWVILLTSTVWAQEPQKLLSLEESIKIAMERSLALHSAAVGIVGSEYRRKEAITNFLPWWTGEYVYTRYNTPNPIGTTRSAILGGEADRNIFNFDTTVNQPIFTGGLNLATYRSAKLGVDLS